MVVPVPLVELLDTLPQQVWQADATGVLLWMNAQMAEALGHPALPAPLAEALHPEDRNGFITAWQEAQCADSFEREYRLGQTWMLAQARRLPGSALWVGTHTDVTHRRAAEDVWKLALECTGDGVWDWHVQEQAEYFSDGLMRLYGFEPGAVDATPNAFDGRTHPDDLEQMARDREAHFSGSTPLYRNEHRVQAKDGSWKWVLSRGVVIARDGAGRPLRMVGTHTDISERKRQEAIVWQQARVDALTQLPNRRSLRERIERALAQLDIRGEQLAVMFVDLDHFKEVNDSLGHDVGDALLVQVAERLQARMPTDGASTGVVARMGGDEFVLVLPQTDIAGAAHLAAKLMALASAPYQVEQHELTVTPSMGIAMFPTDGDDFDTLCKCADAAMYRAKKDGRNAYRFFTSEMQAQSARVLLLENALRRALHRQQLSLHYQPLFALEARPGESADGSDGGARIVGAEALLRWHHPELGWVSPAEFIPIAETSGLILPIGEWVLREALSQLRRWDDAGLPELTMAVNLSAVQFRHDDLPELVGRVLGDTGMPAERLELELTEGAAMDNPAVAITVMNELHARGVRLAIDDFGTGYSSLSHLKKFRVSKLKIDQSFVRDLTEDAEDRAIVDAVIRMAEALGLQTLAEGVETPGQLDFLRRQGCQAVQGYLLSRPLPADAFAEFVLARAMVSV